MSPPQSHSLLDECDPPPVLVFHEAGAARVLLIGDHAGNAIPASLGDLGLSTPDRGRHIALDLGVEALGRELATTLDCTFIYQPFSRLVIDCNRDPKSPTSILETSDGTPIPGNSRLDPATREERRVAIHEPYHQRIALEIGRLRAPGACPVLIALHSFTPVFGAQRRPWQIGILHDRGETSLSLAMLKRLRQEGSLAVGDNEPYRMDVTDYTIPRHAHPNAAPYLEVEFRQDLLAAGDGVRQWAIRFAGWVRDAIATVGQP